MVCISPGISGRQRSGACAITSEGASSWPFPSTAATATVADRSVRSISDETYIGWSGGTTLDNDQTYVRLDGPSAWVEFSNQSGASTDGIHQHTIFRDETADYGWE